MSADETAGSDGICVVCGKATSGGRGFMTLYLEGRTIALCCPMCQKVYQENPDHYSRRQQTRAIISEVGRVLDGPKYG